MACEKSEGKTQEEAASGTTAGGTPSTTAPATPRSATAPAFEEEDDDKDPKDQRKQDPSGGPKKSKENKAGHKTKKKYNKRGYMDVPVLARYIRYLVSHPEKECAIPPLSDTIANLRGLAHQNELALMDIALASTDWMSLVFCSRNGAGKVTKGPRMYLKYIQSLPGTAELADGTMRHLPLGYAPQNERTWIPVTAGKQNFWIDPATGQQFNHDAPYIVMWDGGDDTSWEIFRAQRPPQTVMDIIAILKAYTNGLFAMGQFKRASTVWECIKKSIKFSEDVEQSFWKKRDLLQARFEFRTKNIFEMKSWKDKTTLRIKTESCHLGFTTSMVRSRVLSQGYDLSKIPGFPETRCISNKGWMGFGEAVQSIMSIQDFRQLDGALQTMGKRLSHAQMKLLSKACNGEPLLRF